MATIFQQDEEQTENQQAQGGTGTPAPGGLQTIGTAAPSTGATMATPDKRPQGSGRFTNLQKYIQANSGAGERIAGQVGKEVQKDVSKEQQQSQDYYSQLGKAVTQAQDVAKQGQGFTQQLGDIGSQIQGAGYQQGADIGTQAVEKTGLDAITQFTQNPNFQEFQNIQAGRGIDETLLGMRQAQAARESQQFLEAAQQAQSNLGSEAGRFDLLRKTFGGAARPGYTTGQQRLDQALLAQSGLGDLRQDLSQQVQTARGDISGTQQAAGQISSLGAQEQAIMEQIADQTQANTKAYMDMLNTYIDPTQAARAKEWSDLGKGLSTYSGTGSGGVSHFGIRPGFNAEQMQRLGVGANQGVYNALKGLTTSDIAKQGAAAKTAQDVATQSDVDRYAALAKIAGIDPSALTQASQIGESYGQYGTSSDLNKRLSKAQRDFDKAASGETKGYWASGRQKYNEYATYQDLINKGKGGIKTRTAGRFGSGMRPKSPSQARARNYVMEQFNQFINDQNYRQTLGGMRGTAQDKAAMDSMPAGTTVKLGGGYNSYAGDDGLIKGK